MGLTALFVRLGSRSWADETNRLSALGRKTQELVAPSGCCPGSGNGSGRSERVGSSEQSRNDLYYFKSEISKFRIWNAGFVQFQNFLSSTSPAITANPILSDSQNLES